MLSHLFCCKIYSSDVETRNDYCRTIKMLARHLILVFFVELTKSRVQAIMYVLSENADLSGRSSSLGSLLI